ncbi:unnamed protein product, partial [Staurois parvus]
MSCQSTPGPPLLSADYQWHLLVPPIRAHQCCLSV